MYAEYVMAKAIAGTVDRLWCWAPANQDMVLRIGSSWWLAVTMRTRGKNVSKFRDERVFAWQVRYI